MIYLLITAWLWWNPTLPVNQISRTNQARRDAESAYRAGQYTRALTLYTFLSQTTTSIDPAVRLNLGHTYFQLNQFAKAKPQYETLLRSDRPDLRTVAATQLGVIACRERDSSMALALFRQALLEDPENEPARYNFELIKKTYSGKLPASNPRRKPVPANRRVANKQQRTGQEVERSARQDDLLRRFRQLNMTEEQAMQLLDAMQSNDLPYALTRSARLSASTKPAGNSRW